MKQSEWNRYRELCGNILLALTEVYENVDELPVEYQLAVNPQTFEVEVINGLDETPKGWIYECLVDGEWETIQNCASQYFDFR